jgi:hypothetical protein
MGCADVPVDGGELACGGIVAASGEVEQTVGDAARVDADVVRPVAQPGSPEVRPRPPPDPRTCALAEFLFAAHGSPTARPGSAAWASSLIGRSALRAMPGAPAP